MGIGASLGKIAETSVILGQQLLVRGMNMRVFRIALHVLLPAAFSQWSQSKSTNDRLGKSERATDDQDSQNLR
jgi:hypothetical protein